jgi:hypothetical protein
MAILIAAKSTNRAVTIRVAGCQWDRPALIAVYY